MYASIRHYRVNPDASSRVIQQIIEDFAPNVIADVDGLRAYYVLDLGEGAFATITICESQEVLEECSSKAAEWMRQYIAQSVLSRKNLNGFLVEVGATFEGGLQVGVPKSSNNQFPKEEEANEHARQDASMAAERSQGEQLLSPREVSELLGMGRSWVYQRIRSGEIPSMRMGRNIKVRRKDLNKYLKTQSHSQLGE